MRIAPAVSITGIAVLVAVLAEPALGNGGPFVMKYPAGDPAAKGTVAVIDPNLKPARESRLKVVKEDLRVTFVDAGTQDTWSEGRMTKRRRSDVPLVKVTAAYEIQNPTDGAIEVDFGFPILRGVYLSPYSMVPSPDVQVRLGKQYVAQELISNSAIYGIIRQRARDTIEAGVRAKPRLGAFVRALREADDSHRGAARAAMVSYLTHALKWNARTAALMAEYSGNRIQHPEDVIIVYGSGSFSSASWPNDRTPMQMTHANLGPLRAIGEQKATQFFTQLASAFDPKAASTYEAIFAAWGGDVRERSVDLTTGRVHPREITIAPEPAAGTGSARSDTVFGRSEYPADPTVYARVDYLDKGAHITEAERESCKRVLKNLDVTFTFAPMNLLHYHARFLPNATETLTVEYKQYAYADTRDPASYQLAYVVHPASLWDSFGPISVDVAVPEGVAFRASVPTAAGGVEERDVSSYPWGGQKEMVRCAVHRATLASKRDEVYLAVDTASWGKRYPVAVTEVPSVSRVPGNTARR
jgi:hypothetical protein